MSGAPPVWGFVGRQKELSLFRAALSGESDIRIINVTGIGGVGKSALVEEFARIARGQRCSVGLVNARRLTDPNDIHNYPAVVEALVSLEQTLRDAGCALAGLKALLERYQRLHQQLTEKFAGQDGAAVGAILQVGVSAIRAGATVFPVAKPLNAVLTPELVTQVGQAIASFRRDADRRLLAQPVEELTREFVKAVNQHVRASGRRVGLIFDEFELIPLSVESWVRECTAKVFGAIDSRVVFVIAGRVPVGQDWTARGQTGGPASVRHLQLDEFSQQEVVEYLTRSADGVEAAAARRIAAALGPSYQLPLALRLVVNDSAYLADAVGRRGRLGVLADALVDRLLDDRYTTPEQRRTALSVAVARRFDYSLIAAVEPGLDAAAARRQMEWLSHQHFINPHTVAYSYYDLVRDIFLNYLENTERPLLEELHTRLRDHYQRLLMPGRPGERMRNMAVEMAYHQLSVVSDDPLAEALGLLFQFLPAAYEYGIAWSRMLQQVLAERSDIAGPDRQRLGRLAAVLEQSWRLSVPLDGPVSERAADPALNILFTSSFDDSLPEVTRRNAELWLAYFESRLKTVAGSRDEISEAYQELLRVWEAANDLAAAGWGESLLRFRVASDLADIHTRRGDLGKALELSERAIEIAEGDDVPIRRAFALYQLSNNQKRQGQYQAALRSLSEAIDLVRRHPTKATNYYLGRFLLDRGVTLTYLSEAAAAEEAFSASRACLADISPMGCAELSHRIGWLQRVRGDLDSALAEHETAITLFHEVEAGLGASPGAPSHVSYPLAKALHSLGNVFADMCRHGEALSRFALALELFGRQDGVRHEAIVLKDRAWSRFMVDGPAAAEEDLMRAVTGLGPRTMDAGRPAVNSATHLAEAWLTIALIRSLTRRFDEASDAADRAQDLLAKGENPPMLRRLQVQRTLNSALRGWSNCAVTAVSAIAEEAARHDPPLWLTAARAKVVEAAVAHMAGDSAREERAIATAREWASRWNSFGLTTVEEFWGVLNETMGVAAAPHGGSPHSELRLPELDSADELIDVYDEQRRPLGHASARLAHSIGLWHRSFHCWVAGHDADGRAFVLLQRRGPHSRSFPNYFDISAAGHYRAGEGVTGGIRECEEELGITVRPGDLEKFAERVINEALRNGTVNREFQDIYLLRREDAAESYRPGYPEVSAVVQCPVEDLLQMVLGQADSTPFTGVCVDAADGLTRPFHGRLTAGDLIAEARDYHVRVLMAIRDKLGHGAGLDHRVGRAPERLPDGSQWTRLT